MKKAWLVLFSLMLLTQLVHAQCKPSINETDPFDSVHTVAGKIINIGDLVPSKFETVDGPKLIEEAKLLFSYSEKDSIRSFFLIVAVQEWEYQRVSNDFNVLLLLDDGQVIELMNFSDQGTFDASTNMRLYQHTCLIPMDLVFALTYLKLDKIRINYRDSKRTLTLKPLQQEEFRKTIRCVGEASGLLPVIP